MTISFFLRDNEDAPDEDLSLPEGMTLTAWSPRKQATLPLLPVDPLRLAVWLQDRSGLFDDRRYTELSIWRGTVRIHRLIVTPRWHRFPFMMPGDLQLGGLWTDSALRRQGIARTAMSQAHRRFAASGQRFWYLTESANLASAALARAAGYRLVGEGQRTKPFGIAMLGQFRIERPIAAS